MNKNIRLIMLAAVCIFGAANSVFPGWLKFKPLKKQNHQSETVKETVDPRMVFRFFDEDFVSGGYAYWYPENSNVFIPEESGKNGEVAVQFDLVANDYSGGSVCLYNLLYDMRDIYEKGALQFWIKGKAGNEIAWVALVDDENADGKKTVVRLPLQKYGGISNDWKLISIPLSDFGKRGVFWDAKKRIEVPEKFNWATVCEFRVEIKKNDNPNFTVWVDDIFVLKDVYEAKPVSDEVPWDEKEDEINGPPLAERPAVQEKMVFFDDMIGANGFPYVYGGKTAQKILSSKTKGNEGVLACYMDNNDYSGVTIALGTGSTFNLEPARKAKAAGLAFWGKGGPGVGTIYIGLIDDESDGAKTQTKLSLGDFGKIDTNWNYYMIPLRKFLDVGRYWDDSKKAEVIANVKWDKISEVRFSSNKGENKVADGEPVIFYVDQITIIDEIPGYVDPEEYWNAFKSESPDVLLSDFEDDEDNSRWETSVGPKSEVRYDIATSGAKNGGKNALVITFKMNDWCDVIYNFKNNNRPDNHRDWSKHWGLKFEMYSEKPFQGINVQINDGSGEVWLASAGCLKGWHEVLVPFKTFYKFPYWQPPEADQNGKLDLEGVMTIDFKASGEGTAGKFMIDNIRLTNEREVRAAPVKEVENITVTADMTNVITPSINAGIFGINAALWDGDMLKPATVDYVKAVNHAVLRYPGGLRADEDHWKEVLDKKDFMVDTDEFLEFCKQTGTTPMVTVNFGTGTPEEAAEWVRYMNVTKKANVKYYEVGNELYGSWHANYCTAEEYGKRAAEFIKAMKAVDPSIIVTVVWVLEGEWNKIVFDYTKELADGVNVHHYPQHTGEENDAALLGAPQSLDEILPNVRKQTEQYGVPGKKYEVWLTEWNSVDFKPGPQTLSIVNALFVADYLGSLAKHNIEQASYWDIHNDVTEQGGDYGYLSRTGAPDGDNVPRSSYWAFKMASDCLRGKLVHSSTGNENVTSYLTENNGKLSLLIVNKMPKTKANTTINIPQFEGSGTLMQLRADNMKQGYSKEPVEVKKGMNITLPAYSVTVITLN